MWKTEVFSAHQDEITAPETQDLKETLLPYVSIYAKKKVHSEI